MTDDSYHVASFVVHAQPAEAGAVAQAIAALDGLEVHANEGGKLVVTAEASDVRGIAGVAARLEALPAVLAVAPVYHQYDDGTPHPGDTPDRQHKD